MKKIFLSQSFNYKTYQFKKKNFEKAKSVLENKIETNKKYKSFEKIFFKKLNLEKRNI